MAPDYGALQFVVELCSGEVVPRSFDLSVTVKAPVTRSEVRLVRVLVSDLLERATEPGDHYSFLRVSILSIRSPSFCRIEKYCTTPFAISNIPNG